MLCTFVEYREAFKCFDLNENGTLSTKELKYAMRMLGSNPTDSQVQELVNEKDFDGKTLCLLITLVMFTYWLDLSQCLRAVLNTE